MAVTPISPPVGELPSTTTPVRFTVDNLVGLVIAVDHSDSEVLRPQELIFADGVFLYPYLGSSSLVGNEFSILRQGGWASFEERNKVRVFEQPPVPTEGQPFAALYEVDLTAQPSQTMTAAGSYTIDGKTWWAKGTLWGDGVHALVNGSGMRLFAPATLAGGAQPDRPNFRTVTTTILQRIVFFPFDEIEDYNPAAPLFVQWRLSGAITASSSNRCSSLGVMTAAPSAAAITDGERLTCAQVCHDVYNSASAILCGATGGQVPVTAVVNDAALASYRTGVQRFAKDRFYVIHKHSAVDVTPEDTLDLSGVNGLMQPTAQGDMGLFFTLHKAFSDGATLDVYLTHLKVMQPKVAA